MAMLCKAILFFEKQQFELALEFLNNTHFRDIQGKLLERRLRLRIYLELGYDDTFLDQINSFRKFLSVNKSIVPEHHYNGNKSFIQAANLIYKAQKEGIKSLNELKRHVESSLTLPEKHWIDSYIERLHQRLENG